MNRGLTIERRIGALRGCPVFAGLPPDELALLAELVRSERLLAGEALFEAGDPSDRVFVIVSGQLDVCLPGQEAPVRSLGPGGLLGEYGLVLEEPRTASVRAKIETALLSLDNTRFRAFLLQYPEATLVLLRTAAQRLVEAEKHAWGS